MHKDIRFRTCSVARSFHSIRHAALRIVVLSSALSGVLSTPGQTAHFSGLSLGSGFNNPTGLAVDASGDVFVADEGNNAIKEIVAINGVISNQSQILSLGSGYYEPQNLVVDPSGNIFVADYGGNTVKEVVAPGYTTVLNLGGGYTFPVPAGVALDSSGNLWVADQNSTSIQMIAAAGYTTVTSFGSGLTDPVGVAVDSSGDVFVANWTNPGKLKELLAPDYTTINTITSTLNYPIGLAIDPSNNLFVADYGNNVVKELLAAGGYATINSLNGGFSGPNGVAVDSHEDVFVADTNNNLVRELLPQGQGINFGPAAVATTTPATMTLVFVFDTAGTLGSKTVLTQGATGLDFTEPSSDTGYGVCTADTSYVQDQICTITVAFNPTRPGPRYGAVVLYNTSGAPIATGYVYGSGTGPQVGFTPYTRTTLTGAISNPEGIAGDGSGNLYVAADSSVYELPYSNGGLGSAAQILTSLSQTQWLTVDGAGNLFLADGGNSRILEETLAGGSYTATTICNSCAGNEIAVDGSGNLYTLSASLNGVVKLTLQTDGSYSAPVILGISPGNNPWSIAVDAVGNVFYSDQGNGCLYELTPADGGYAQSQLDCTLSSPQGMTIDNNGNLYLTETTNGDIIEYTLSNGTYSKVSTPVITGLTSSSGLWIDPTGNLFVSNSGANQVLKLDSFDPPTLTFAATTVGSASASNPQTVSVENTGNAPLTLPQPGSGANPVFTAGFAYDDLSTCDTITASRTITAGSSCTLAVNFLPVAIGSPITGTATLTDNSLNVTGATQALQLSGTATQASQTITFPNPGSQTIGNPLTLNATASSGLAVSYASSTSGVCTVSGSVTTFLSAGSCTITASQSGNATFAAATSVSQTIVVGQSTPTILWPGKTGITYGTNLSSVLNAGADNSSGTALAGSYSYSVTTGNTSSPVTAATVLSAGTYSLTVVFTPTDAAYKTATASLALTVMRATPSVALISSASTILVTDPVTLTTTLSTALGAPTGSVSFLDGTTMIASSAMVSGVATVTTSSLTVGNHSITAVYSGDNNFAAVTTAAVTETVQDISLTIAPGSGGVTAVTTTLGGTALYTLVLSPVGASVLPAAVTLSAGGLPPGASATFTPAALAAGAGATTVTMTIQLPATSASARHRTPLSRGARGAAPLALALIVLPFAGRLRHNGRHLRRIVCPLALVAALTGVGGCGSSSGFFAQPPQTYTVTVTGTSGVLVRSTTVTLTVE